MYCIAIDTSSKFLCVALINNREIIAKYNKSHDRQHNDFLISKIEKVIKASDLSAGDIDCIAIGIGPGSFTGLRIGIAAAKGLSIALNKPLIGLCSLDMIALLQEDGGGIICPIVDAKRQQVYSGTYKYSQGKIKRKSEYFLGPIDELLKKISGRVIFCGDAINLYKDSINKCSNIKPVFAKEKDWYPLPVSFSKVCYDLYRKKCFNNSEGITPIYLYENTCSLNRKASAIKRGGSAKGFGGKNRK